jgi:pyridoxine 5-phosphate synthase
MARLKRRLGVNIDHIATLRQARLSAYPDPADSLPILKKCHVDQVTLHLREDRRHIQDADVAAIIKQTKIPVNLEMAVTGEMLAMALRSAPDTVTLVPEKRQEVTTEGGLDCLHKTKVLAVGVGRLRAAGIRVSLFIDPEPTQIKAAVAINADAVEFHTGTYCESIEAVYRQHGHYRWQKDKKMSLAILCEWERLANAAKLAKEVGLAVFAGHGLHAHNLQPVTKIREIEEYNIGHAIMARAVFIGLAAAIKEIQAILNRP